MNIIIENELIEIEGLNFVKYIDSTDIEERIAKLANKVNADYHGQKLTFLVVLNGAFMFAAQLLKTIKVECEIHFISAKSYKGLTSTNQVSIRIPEGINLDGKNVLIIEDIVDTAQTIIQLKDQLVDYGVKNAKICSLLSKPKKHNIEVDYLGFEIPDLFVVGYGLDYHQQGRNLADIYQIRNDFSE
jgi:hypoxanthine phosphoribosyltransferase